MGKQRQARKKVSTRNPEIIPGLRLHGRTASAQAAGQWKHTKKGDTRTAAQKTAAADKRKRKLDITKPRFYAADDVKTPLKSNRGAPKTAQLKKSITPGTVLIVLAGRFRGKRVVFLKQLASGLLLVTGPYKVNGVPLRRVNQAYTIATSTKVDVSKVDVSKIGDAFFARSETKESKEFAEKKDEKKHEVSKERKAAQTAVDSALVAAMKGTPQLAHYLNAKFTLTNNQRPHLMKF